MADDNRPFRFLHLSDVLLDARLSCRELGMSAPKRFERNKEALRSFLHLCEAARQRQLDAVIVTGNLWEGQSVTAATAAALVDAFYALGDMPVLLVPGSFDPLTPQSLYNSKVLSVHGIRPWSKNVHVFDAGQFQPWTHPKRPNVVVYGRANLGFTGERTLPAVDPAAGAVSLLADYQPFSSGNINALKPFAAAAFGGALNYSFVVDESGAVRAGSPGSLIGRSVAELGPRCALAWSIEPGVATYERVPSDARQIVSISVSINGVRANTVADFISKTAESSGARSGLDIVHAVVSGIYPPGQSPDLGEQPLGSHYFHAKISDQTRPDYFVDRADQRTTAGRFIAFLQDLKTKAEARGGTTPASEYGGAISSAQIENALYYGLEALNQKKVTVPDVD